MSTLLSYGPSPNQVVERREHAGLRAGVLFIHGGGWENGTRENWEAQAAELHWLGYHVWNMDYRLSPECEKPWLDITWDVAHVIERFTQTGKLRSLSLVGDSAGGHLALMYAMSNPSAINSVLALSPVTDPVAWRTSSPYFADMYKRFVGGSYEERPQRWRDYSPVERLRSGAHLPRTWIYGSAADTITPRYQVDVFFAEAASRGKTISGHVTQRCQSTYPDHGTRLLPCCWSSMKAFLPRPS